MPLAQKDAVRLVRNITGLSLAQHNLLGVERVSSIAGNRNPHAFLQGAVFSSEIVDLISLLDGFPR